MSDPAKAVFLSYASQDAAAARKICEALRAAGIEVWFDQSELVGGDAWDQKIRKQIRECALLIPVISQTTQGRREAYFRLEWKLADERTHLMAKGTPFLLPVTIDETGDRDAVVPDSFPAVQWTKAPGGEVPAAFAARVKVLLGGGVEMEAARPRPAQRDEGVAPPFAVVRRPRRLGPVVAAAAVVVALLGFALVRTQKRPAPVAPLSEARQLVERAKAIYENRGAMTHERLETAEDLCRRAIELDSSDGEAWAAAACVDALTIYWGFDASDERRQQAQQRAARALVLAPDDFEARHAQALVFGWAPAMASMREEAVTRYRALLRERPENQTLRIELGTVLRDMGKFDEAAALLEQAGDLGSAAWNYIYAGRFPDARRMVERLLQNGPTPDALHLKCYIETVWDEDLEAARRTVSQYTPEDLLKDAPTMDLAGNALYRRAPATAIAVLTAFPSEYFASPGSRGPKRYILGLAQELAGNPDAARAEWRAALRIVQERQKATPNDVELLGWRAMLHACLGDRDEAERLLATFRGRSPQGGSMVTWATLIVEIRLGQLDKALNTLETVARTDPVATLRAHVDVRFSPEFDPLRGDLRFEKLRRDTRPPGAKPFDETKPAVKS